MSSIAPASRGPGLDDRQREVAAGAVGLIAEQGFGNTGVRDFAGALGISVRALYEVVRTKEEILSLVVEYWAELWRSALEPIVGREAEPLERLRLCVHTLLDFGNEHPHFSAVIYREQTRFDGRGRRALSAREKERIHLVAAIVCEGIDAGYIRPDLDPPRLAAQLLLLIDALPVRRSLSLNVPGNEAWRDAVLEMVMNGYGPPAVSALQAVRPSSVAQPRTKRSKPSAT